jgi:RNA polymerase sigma factor (sigma-70 family)
MPSGRASQEIFERLLEDFHGQVFHFFRRRGLGVEDSLDLTQDTFFRVFNHIDRLRAQEARTTWILTIAANRWKNWLRHRSAQKRAALEMSLDSLVEDSAEPRPAEELPAGAARPDDPLRGLLGKERVEQVVEAIERLPPKQERCLRLKVFQGRTYSEIAVLLGISEQTVKSHIHQARRRLVEEVAPEIEGERKGDSDEP